MNKGYLLTDNVKEYRLDLLLANLKAGCDPNDGPRTSKGVVTPLHWTMNKCNDGGLPLAKALLKYGASPSSEYDGISELWYAILNRNVEIAWLLIDYGADPSVNTPKKWLPAYEKERTLLQEMFDKHNEKLSECACVLSVRSKSKLISHDVIGLVAEHLYSFRIK